MTDNLTIERTETDAEKEAYIRFQWEVYKNDPYWVPPPVSERVEFLDPQRHPFYQHADVVLFLARRGDQVVGRIAALVNHRHNEFWDEQIGFFGLFEVLEDPEAANLLLETASQWVKEQGMTAIRGPMNFSTNEEVGLLVDGWDGPPVIMMTYNPPYYADFIENAGFAKVMDLPAFLADLKPFYENGLPERAVRIAQRVKEKRGITARGLNMRYFDQEVEKVKKIYNAAWAKNWGFVPMTDAEFDHVAAGLKQILDPHLCCLIEKENEPIGFALILPDISPALLKAYPNPDTPEWWSMVKLFWHWKIRPTLTTARAYAGGILEPHRGVGADVVMGIEVAQRLIDRGYRYAEISWVLETNIMMKRLAEFYGGEIYRNYRVYERPL